MQVSTKMIQDSLCEQEIDQFVLAKPLDQCHLRQEVLPYSWVGVNVDQLLPAPWAVVGGIESISSPQALPRTRHGRFVTQCEFQMQLATTGNNVQEVTTVGN